MIGAWVVTIITALAALCSIVGIIFWADEDGKKKPLRLLWIIPALIVAGVIIGYFMFWLYGTESGARAQKTFDSQVHGGLERHVTVYDVEGDVLQEYDGKFDVEEDYEAGIVKVKFDEGGKRHIIYSNTGTVIIDETGEEGDK